MNNEPHTEQTPEPQTGQPSDGQRHIILGTAGHIDHGKTALIRALSGTDTDRLPEEKRRGMTIELGFAGLTIDDTTFGIVDVPGHERFVRTMVAGATGMDMALLIVAADDSVMPQTVEHVEILNLLGIRHAIVAITKCDLVDDDLADLVEAEVHELLADTAMADAPIVRVSSITGQGIDNLKTCISQIAQSVERNELNQPFRLSVDRAFTVSGRGLVVTGSVISGQLHPGDSVDIWPIGQRARVREVQSHGHDANLIEVGQRAAINLSGIDKDIVTRGCDLAAVGIFQPTRLVDARLCCLTSHQRPIKNQSKLRLCVGTTEVMARIVSMTGTAIQPGQHIYAQLRCAEPVTVSFGQRFILRDENAARTAGGGIVLRAATRRISPRLTDEINGLEALQNGEPLQRVAEVMRYAQFNTPSEGQIALAAGLSKEDVPNLVEQLAQKRRLTQLVSKDHLVSTEFLKAFLTRAQSWLRRYHQSHPDEPGCLVETLQGWLERKSDKSIAKTLLDKLLKDGNVRQMGRYVCLREFAPAISAQDERLLQSMLDILSEAAFQPPSLKEIAAKADTNLERVRKLVKVATSINQLVQIDPNIYLHVDRETELRQKVEVLYNNVGPFTVAQLRETIDSSRKYAVPIAAYLDRAGITKRDGDYRELANRHQDNREPANKDQA